MAHPSTDETLQRIMAQLKRPKKQNGWTYALCPHHADTQRSFKVGMGDEGAILLKCYAGCSLDDLCKSLGLSISDLFPPRAEDYRSREPEEVYDYRDEHGSLVYQVLRYPGKKIAQRRWIESAGDFANNMEGVERILYNLPAVIRAVQARQPVFVTEGEKDANTLTRLGFVATTNSGGAGKWDERFTHPLTKGHIVVLHDNDAAGLAHAVQVVNSLLGPASTLRLVHLPGLPHKGDVTDWVRAGGTAEQLRALAKAAPVLKHLPVAERNGRGGLSEALGSIAAYGQAHWMSGEELLRIALEIIRTAF